MTNFTTVEAGTIILSWIWTIHLLMTNLVTIEARPGINTRIGAIEFGVADFTTVEARAVVLSWVWTIHLVVTNFIAVEARSVIDTFLSTISGSVTGFPAEMLDKTTSG